MDIQKEWNSGLDPNILKRQQESITNVQNLIFTEEDTTQPAPALSTNTPTQATTIHTLAEATTEKDQSQECYDTEEKEKTRGTPSTPNFF